MAKPPVVSQGKTAFVKEQLEKDSSANHTTISEAWNQAGNEGKISGSLVYQVRRGMGLTGGGRGKSRGGGATATKSTSAKKSGRKSTTNGTSLQPNNGSRQTEEPVRASHSQPRADRGRALDEVEAGIDELIFRLKEQGGMEEVQRHCAGSPAPGP